MIGPATMRSLDLTSAWDTLSITVHPDHVFHRRWIEDILGLAALVREQPNAYFRTPYTNREIQLANLWTSKSSQSHPEWLQARHSIWFHVPDLNVSVYAQKTFRHPLSCVGTDRIGVVLLPRSCRPGLKSIGHC